MRRTVMAAGAVNVQGLASLAVKGTVSTGQGALDVTVCAVAPSSP